jgi:hypothetical protein
MTFDPKFSSLVATSLTVALILALYWISALLRLRVNGWTLILVSAILFLAVYRDGRSGHSVAKGEK